MPVWIERDNKDPSIVIQRFGATWTWEEYDVIEAEFRAMAAEAPGRIDLIADGRQTISFPAGIMDRAIDRMARRRLGEGITVVVASTLVLEMLQILSMEIPGFGHRVYHTATLEDAYRIIEEDRRGPARNCDPGRNN